jgi:predicted phosphodiesterase
VKIALAIGDTHFPQHSIKTLDIANKIGRDLKPDYLIFGGDNWDADGISKFTVKAPEDGLIETYNQMLDFKKVIFDRLVKSCGGPEVRLLLGNHDGQRLTDFLRKAQEKGHNNIYNYWSRQFDYKKIFNCKIIPYNDYTKLGKLHITHGEKHNKYHAASHLDLYMGSVLHFHLHTKQIFTRISKGNEPHQGISAPCACELNPDYMKNRASTWINGFVVIYFTEKSFFYNIVQVINGETVFNGKVYK